MGELQFEIHQGAWIMGTQTKPELDIVRIYTQEHERRFMYT